MFTGGLRSVGSIPIPVHATNLSREVLFGPSSRAPNLHTFIGTLLLILSLLISAPAGDVKFHPFGHWFLFLLVINTGLK